MRGRGLKDDLGQKRQTAYGRRPDTCHPQQSLEILGMPLVCLEQNVSEPLMVDVQIEHRMPGRGEECRSLGQPFNLSQQPSGRLLSRAALARRFRAASRQPCSTASIAARLRCSPAAASAG